MSCKNVGSVNVLFCGSPTRRRWLSYVWSVSLVVVLLAGCGGQPAATAIPTAVPPTAATQAGQPAVEKERTTVRFTVSDLERPLYEPLIAAFEQENPSLHVQVVSLNEVLGLTALAGSEIPEDAEQRLVAAADVVNFSVTRETVQQGLVRDLAPLIEADTTFDAPDFYPGSLESYQWQGGAWAVPNQLNFRLIFYNKDAFDAARVSYPTAGWSWDDLLVKARATMERQGDQVTRWGIVWPYDAAYYLVESRTGSMVDYAADPPQPRYDDPKVIESVDWYANLYLREQVMPYSGARPKDQVATTLSEEETLIDKGKAAMWPDLAQLWSYRKMQGKVGVAPFPSASPDGKTTPAWTSSLAMSAGTTVPDAAWRWMMFLTRQVPQGFGQGIKPLPARRSVVETEAFWQGMDEELATALRYALDHGYVVRERASSDAFEQALHAVLREESKAGDALANAQTLVMAEAQTLAQEGAVATPKPTFVVAPAKPEAPTAAAVTRITFIPGLGSLNLEPYRRWRSDSQELIPTSSSRSRHSTSRGPAAPTCQPGGVRRLLPVVSWLPGPCQPRGRPEHGVPSWMRTRSSAPTFHPQALDQFDYQGQLLGLPADITPFVIEYNKALFDAAG